MHEPERRAAPAIFIEALPEQPEAAAFLILYPVIVPRPRQVGDWFAWIGRFQLCPDFRNQRLIRARVELGL
ncbi:MAG: hypothetical protein MK186_09650 [Henriciella sp.]|nr:hypothetical protein [Henriciella sp.]